MQTSSSVAYSGSSPSGACANLLRVEAVRSLRGRIGGTLLVYDGQFARGCYDMIACSLRGPRTRGALRVFSAAALRRWGYGASLIRAAKEGARHFFQVRERRRLVCFMEKTSGREKNLKRHFFLFFLLFSPRRFERAIRKRPNTVRCLAVKSTLLGTRHPRKEKEAALQKKLESLLACAWRLCHTTGEGIKNKYVK